MHKKFIIIAILIFAAFLRLKNFDQTLVLGVVGLMFAIATIFMVWLLVDKLFPKQRPLYFAEVAAFFLSISPWHISFSKVLEANVLTFLLVLGVFMYSRAAGNRKWFYTSAILMLLVISGLREVSTLKNSLSVVQEPVWEIEEQRREHIDYKNTQSLVLHNKLTNYTLAFLGTYIEHFSPEFLFFQSNNGMQLFALLFLPLGLVFIARQPSGWGMILLLLFIAPIFGSLGFQLPNALKSHTMVIPLEAINAFGFVGFVGWVITRFKNKNTRRLIHF